MILLSLNDQQSTIVFFQPHRPLFSDYFDLLRVLDALLFFSVIRKSIRKTSSSSSPALTVQPCLWCLNHLSPPISVTAILDPSSIRDFRGIRFRPVRSPMSRQTPESLLSVWSPGRQIVYRLPFLPTSKYHPPILTIYILDTNRNNGLIKHLARFSVVDLLLYSPLSVTGPHVQRSTFLSTTFVFSSSLLAADQVSRSHVKTGRKKTEYRYSYDFLDGKFDLNCFANALYCFGCLYLFLCI